MYCFGQGSTSCDVSGAQRFKYFSNAFPLPSPSPTSHILADEKSTCYESPSKQRMYKESGTQTEKYVHRMSESEKKVKLEKDIAKKIHIDRMKRQRERREQEAALPPMTDPKSIKAYRIFLEENEQKDFALREKELDDSIQRKLQTIKDDLENRFSDTNDDVCFRSLKTKKVWHWIFIKLM